MKSLSKQQIKLDYILKSKPTRHLHVPRKGFYWFRELLDVKISDRLEMFKVEAYYNPQEPDFSHEFSIPAQVSSFFNAYSKGPKDISYGDIIGTVVHVKEVKLEEYTFNDEPQGRYIVEWDIIEYRDFSSVTSQQLNEDMFSEQKANEATETDEEEEVIDWELEEIFWELNQMSESENVILWEEWELKNQLTLASL